MSREGGEKLLDRILPIRSIDDLVTRGMWSGQIVHQSALDRLPTIPRIASIVLTQIIGGHLITKESRQPVPAFLAQEEAKPRTPEYLYPLFVQLSKVHWLLRTIIRASIGEVLTPGYEIEARYKNKCKKCDKEYDNAEIKECDICKGTDFDTPDIDQYKQFRGLIGLDLTSKSMMGEGRTFNEFLYSTLWYILALDDFYWEIGHTETFDPGTKEIVSTPQTVHVLDGSITFPVMDSYGNFTSNEYFCQVCYKKIRIKTKTDPFIDLTSITSEADKNNPICKEPGCGRPLIRTAYIQKVGGKIVARFGKDEVIHSSSSRVAPEAFGLSKIVAAVKLLYVIDYMDEYNLQIYGKGHATTIIGVEGADKAKVEEISLHVQNELRGRKRIDSRTGEARVSLEPVITFIGLEQGKTLTPIDISPNLSEMQSIDYYRLYVEKVCGLFGVSPIFVTLSEPGSGGIDARPQIDVQNRVTRQYMSDVLDPFNDFLLPQLGITDWVLNFGKVESRDELRDKKIIQTTAMAASLLLAQGFDVTLTEDGRNMTVSPKPVRPSEASSRLTAGKIPQDMDGATERTAPGGVGDGISEEEPEVEAE